MVTVRIMNISISVHCFLLVWCYIYQIQVECDHKSNNNQIKSNCNPDLFTDVFLITFTTFSGELWTFPVFAHSPTLPSPPHNIHSKLHVCFIMYTFFYVTITMAYGSKCQSVCKSKPVSIIYSRMWLHHSLKCWLMCLKSRLEWKERECRFHMS